MITLPSFLQGVSNPVPRVKHPDWILKRKREQEEGHKQQRLTTMFQSMREHNLAHPPTSIDTDSSLMDIEDVGTKKKSSKPIKTKKKVRSNVIFFCCSDSL